MDNFIVEATIDKFKDLIKNNENIVIVFSAEWCGPCKRLMPVFSEVAEKMYDKVKFIKVDVDNIQEVAYEYKVMSIPTLIFIKNGLEVDRIVGSPAKDSLENKINNVFEM